MYTFVKGWSYFLELGVFSCSLVAMCFVYQQKKSQSNRDYWRSYQLFFRSFLLGTLLCIVAVSAESFVLAAEAESYSSEGLKSKFLHWSGGAPIEDAGKLTEDFLAATDFNELDHQVAEKKDGEWLIAPIPSLSPDLGWTVTLPIARLSKRPNAAPETPVWVSGLLGFYAQDGSYAYGAFQKMNFKDDRWRLLVAAFGGDMNYDYYLQETGEQAFAIPLNQDIKGSMAELLRAVVDNLYFGFRVSAFQTTVRLDEKSIGLDPGTLPPELGIGFSLVNLTPKVVYDTRNNEFYPDKGVLAELDWMVSSTSFGSDVDYDAISANWNQYQKLGNKGIIAARATFEYAGGDSPFFLHPTLGMKSDLRGYTPGKHRDQTMVTAQLEYRWKFPERWGVVAFAGVGGVGPRVTDLREALPSVGVGVRYVLAPKNNVSLRLDVARGDEESHFYIGLGEAF